MELLEKNDQIENGIISASRKHIKGDFSEHGHEFFEIEYIISGSGTYFIDGKSYPIRDKMLFFMSPSNFHAIENCNAEIINVMFSCNLCDTNSLYCLFSPNKVTATSFSHNDIILIETLLKEITESNDINYTVQFLRCILYKLSKLITDDKNDSTFHSNSHIQSAIIYILENFRTNITLNDVANYTKLAPAYLSTLFSKETGFNFKKYIDNIKFDYAIKLLKFTNMSITEVCSTSGFSDYTNFTRRFKIIYGCTPSEYRKVHHS